MLIGFFRVVNSRLILFWLYVCGFICCCLFISVDWLRGSRMRMMSGAS